LSFRDERLKAIADELKAIALSTRTIAEDFGMSNTQVERDLDLCSGEPTRFN